MTRLRGDAWDPRVHQEVQALLPWYANNTLTGPELHDVAAHLATCPACQIDLAQCHALAAAIRATEEVTWSPSPAHVARVLARIEAAETRRTWVRDWWQGLSAWCHVCRGKLQTTPGSVRWALAVQGALVVLLTSLLAWQAPWTPRGQYRTLSDGTVHGSQRQHQGSIRVVFAEDMTASEIRTLLTSIGGTIVHGPSPLGVYTVDLSQAGNLPDLVRSGVATMRAHPKVRLAEPLLAR